MFTETGGTFTGTPSINTTYYLQPARYSVTYNGNGATGGTVPVDDTVYDSGASVTVPDNTGSLVKTGYTFNGWNTKSDGSGTPYAAGASFTITEDITLYAVWKSAAAEPRFAGHDLELRDVLNLNFYLEVPEGFDGTGAYMTLTLPTRTPKRIDFKDAAEENGYKIFTLPVYAYQMADNISAEFTYSGGSVSETYSVETYLKDVMAGKGTPTPTDAQKAMARAALTYGRFIQSYLDNIGTLMGTFTEIYADYSGSLDLSAAISGTSGYRASDTEINSSYVEYVDFLLNVNSGTNLVFEIQFLNGVSGEVTATVTTDNVEPATVRSLGNGKYSISKDGITPNNLDYEYTFTVNVGGTQVFTTRLSALYYVNVVLNDPINSYESDAFTALYQYWYATEHN